MIRLVLLSLCPNRIEEEFQKFVNFIVWDFDLLWPHLENWDETVWLVR